jgi:hypothetical protein
MLSTRQTFFLSTSKKGLTSFCFREPHYWFKTDALGLRSTVWRRVGLTQKHEAKEEEEKEKEGKKA